MAIIDHKHPQASSTVVRRLSDGALVGFLKRINTDAGWLERYKTDSSHLRVAKTADGKPRVVREEIAGKYEVVTGVPPYIKVKGKDGKVKLFRRADVIPEELTAAKPTPAVEPPPPQIKVGGRVYVREDQARKAK
jgi:hypothetical protein